MKIDSWLKTIINYLLKGVLIIAPLSLTIFTLFKIFMILDEPVQYIFERITGFRIYGLGLITLVLLLIFTGFLASTLIFDAIFKSIERLLFKIPLVKEIYKALRDVFGAFVSEKKKFEKPVKVKVYEGIYRIGFITNEDLSDLSESTEEALTAVYFPLSYAFTGELLLVSKDNIIPIHSSKVSDIMKFIISGGIIEKN